MLAQGANRFFELDLTSLDVELLRFKRVRDILGGHRAEELPILTNPLMERDAHIRYQLTQALCLALGFRFTSEMRLSLLLNNLLVCICR